MPSTPVEAFRPHEFDCSPARSAASIGKIDFAVMTSNGANGPSASPRVSPSPYASPQCSPRLFDQKDAHLQPLAGGVKIAYALPRFTIRAGYIIMQLYATLYYMQLGAKRRFMAFYMAIGRGLDVLTDPTMGWVTDQTRTRIGRRKPYMAVGMVAYPVVFGFLFF